MLVVCASNARGATGRFVYRVAGRTIVVGAGHCSGNIRLLADNVTVTEVARPAFVFKGCVTSPTRYLISCKAASRTAKVRIIPGGSSTKTTLRVTKQKAMRFSWF